MALAFYSTATGRLRRITRNSPGESFSNDQLEAHNVAAFGETRIRVRDNLDIPGIEAEVARQSGIIPSADLYAVVDSNGDVVNSIIADPLCNDSIPGFTLVQRSKVRIGWRQMRDGTFQRSLAEIDHDILIQNQKRTTALIPTLTRTQAEADALTAQNVIEADAELIVLTAEFDARVAVR